MYFGYQTFVLEFIVTPARIGDSELQKEIYPLTRQKMFDRKQM